MSSIIESIHRMRSPKKLLQTFEAIKIRLKDLNISSNSTDPVGQYAEYLVSKLYDAEKTKNGTAGCDLITHDNCKVEVKGRVSRKEGYIPKTYINDTNVTGEHFDYLVYVVFTTDYDIERAYGMTINTFKKVSEYVKHNNSAPKWKFKASLDLLEHEDIDNLTKYLAEHQ